MKYSVSPRLFMPSASARATLYEPFSVISSDPVRTVGDSALRLSDLSAPSSIWPVAAGASVCTFTVTLVPSGP